MLLFRGSKEAWGRWQMKSATSCGSLHCPARCLPGQGDVTREVKATFGASIIHTPCKAAGLTGFLFWDTETCDLSVHLWNKGEAGNMILLFIEKIKGNYGNSGKMLAQRL